MRSFVGKAALVALLPIAAWHVGGGLHGRVVDPLGTGLAGVDVEVMHLTGERTDDRSLVTNDRGAYAFAGLVPGLYELSVRRLGFKPLFTQVQIANGTDLTLNIRLEPVTQQLDTVHARAEGAMPEQYGHSLRMAEFYERRAQGMGHFFTREDIEAAAIPSPADLIRRIAGMKVIIGNGSVRIRSTGCAGIRVGGITSLDTSGSQGPMDADGWGNIALYVDGVPIMPGARDQEMASLTADEVEAMEVYRSPTEMPAEAVGNACAAVYVWTRISG